MSFKISLTSQAEEQARRHLLQHFSRGDYQEELCFALWRPSTGQRNRTGLIDRIILPEAEERELHGNASFQPSYMARSIDLACQEKSGLVFIHSHPGEGWQGLSADDTVAERDILAYPAGTTGLPLVGMTIGSDGYWSARFWENLGNGMHYSPCEKICVVGPNKLSIYFDDKIFPPPDHAETLQRTFETLGIKNQQNITRMKVGVVGLGSVGSIVGESLARLGIEQIVLIDNDVIKKVNLDRSLHASKSDIGKLKVEVSKREIMHHSTAKNLKVDAIPLSIANISAYKAALDCDILFSCVDKPVARDVVSYIAHAHLIPVIDGGISVTIHENRFYNAHWRVHIAAPDAQCLRCNLQYDTSMVSAELDGSLEDPLYISNVPENQLVGNQNVFPFSLGIAGMQINRMLQYIMSEEWWPELHQQDYIFAQSILKTIESTCRCEFRARRARGDLEFPPYLAQEILVSKWQAFRRKMSSLWPI